MKRGLTLLVALSLLAVGCGEPIRPAEGCRGHGGVQTISEDATNNSVPAACKDGTIVVIHL